MIILFRKGKKNIIDMLTLPNHCTVQAHPEISCTLLAFRDLERNGFLGTSECMGRHPRLTSFERDQSLDRMFEACRQFHYKEQTLALAVTILDAYLSRTVDISSAQFGGIAWTALYLAAKLEEQFYHGPPDYQKLTRGAVLAPKISKAEAEILTTLQFNLNLATTVKALDFYRHRFHSYEQRALCHYLLDCCHFDPQLNRYYPSLLASATVYISRWPDVQNFQCLFGWPETALRKCAVDIIAVARGVARRSPTLVLIWGPIHKEFRQRPFEIKSHSQEVFMRKLLPLRTLGKRSDYHRTLLIGMGTFGSVFAARKGEITRTGDNNQEAVNQKGDTIPKIIIQKDNSPEVINQEERSTSDVTTPEVTIPEGSVALKKIHPDNEDGLISASGIREIAALLQLQGNPQIPPVRDVFTGENQTLWLCTELMETDLEKALKDHPEWFTAHNQIRVAKQLTRVLAFIHDHGIIHRDVKPENILLKHGPKGLCIQLTDFGQCRGMIVILRAMTVLVCSTWYRAPELLLGCARYSSKIDCWSVGCVLYRMGMGKLLFQGETDIHQLDLICQCLGTPTETTWPRFHEIYEWLQTTQPRTPNWPFLQEKPPELPELCYKIIRATVVLSPQSRATSQELVALYE